MLHLQRYIYINIIALLVIVLSFFIIKPLITLILTAIILAYLFYPIFEKIKLFLLKLWGEKYNEICNTISALAVIIVVIFTFLIPLGCLILFLFLNTKIIVSILSTIVPLTTNLFEILRPYFQTAFIQNIETNLNLSQIFSTIAFQIFKISQDLFSAIPSMLFGSFIILFLMYYLLKNSYKIINFINEWIPVQEELRIQATQRFNQLSRGLIGSQVVIAICQALLMGIACLILGLNHIFLVIAATFIFSFIPFVGAFFIWFTISIYLLIGYLNGLEPLWHPIFLIIYGALLVSTIDNFIRPHMLSGSAKINPAIVLIGFIGGFIVFGLPGVLLGPIILTLLGVAIGVFHVTLSKLNKKG